MTSIMILVRKTQVEYKDLHEHIYTLPLFLKMRSGKVTILHLEEEKRTEVVNTSTKRRYIQKHE